MTIPIATTKIANLLNELSQVNSVNSKSLMTIGEVSKNLDMIPAAEINDLCEPIVSYRLI